MLELVQEVPEQYPTWPATQEFLQGIQAEMFQNSSSLSFRDLSQVIAAVDEKYGRWQSHECGALKAELLQNEEHPGTGRVRLSDFYSMALKGGQWQFSESSSYLRQIGALDETDPQILRVVVPNYILGLSNCIAASSYYMVCCINECDAHLTRLEEALQSHQATVEAGLRFIIAFLVFQALRHATFAGNPAGSEPHGRSQLAAAPVRHCRAPQRPGAAPRPALRPVASSPLPARMSLSAHVRDYEPDPARGLRRRKRPGG